MPAEWKCTLVELFRALHRAGDRPSAARAILLTRALGYHFRTHEAQMVLVPVADELRLLGATLEPLGSRDGSAPSSSICTAPEHASGSHNGAAADISLSSSPPHPLSISSNSPPNKSPQDRRGRHLTAVDSTVTAAKNADQHDKLVDGLRAALKRGSDQR